MESKSKIDDFFILKTLGEGYTGKVKLGQHTKTKKLYALKILNLQNINFNIKLKSLSNEFDIMKNLDNKHIVKFIDIKKGNYIKYKKNKKIKKPVIYAIIELASKGEIFEVIYYAGAFNENLSRFYAHQLLIAIEYLHNNNIAHRDLKPQNLLLDDDSNLKLADFGFSTVSHEDEKNNTRLGTERYKAPEILSGKPYDAKKVDIFAFGVILFVFYSGHPPFYEAKLDDELFNEFVNEPVKFWNYDSNEGNKKKYSESLIYLLSKMLALNDCDRFTIEEIKNSDWMKKEIDYEKAKVDMKKYVEKMKKVVEADKMKEEKITNQEEFTDNKKIERSKKKHRLFVEYNENFLDFNLKFLTDNKDDLVKKMVNSVKKMKKETNLKPKIIWNKNMTKFSIKFLTEFGNSILIKIRFYKIENGFGVSLQKAKGSTFDFYEIRQKLIDTITKK